MIILTKGRVNMASDLSGVGMIDITSGIDTVDEAIRRELASGI